MQREIDVETEEGKLGFGSCTRERQVTSLVKSQVHPPIINISTPPPPNNGADGAVGTLVIPSFSNTLMAPPGKLIVLQLRLVLATKQPSVVTIGTENYLPSSIRGTAVRPVSIRNFDATSWRTRMSDLQTPINLPAYTAHRHTISSSYQCSDILKPNQTVLEAQTRVLHGPHTDQAS
ncbi:hypothetical protein FF1_001522 [Malus domestica]